jgi:hypothetical protein
MMDVGCFGTIDAGRSDNVEVSRNIEEVNTALVERYLHADYTGVLSGWAGEPSVAGFRNPQSWDEYRLSPQKIDRLLKAGEERGYNLPLVRLAQAELADAQRRYRVRCIFNKIGDKLINTLGFVSLCAILGTVVVSVASLGVKARNAAQDSPYQARLNAAAPVAGYSGLTYDSENRTYFQTTKSPRQLLSWTFNEKGGLENACSIAVRQPEDGTLAWWMVPKYNPKCISGEHLSQLSKLPAPLPRPQ